MTIIILILVGTWLSFLVASMMFLGNAVARARATPARAASVGGDIPRPSAASRRPHVSA